jgi:pyoverdine/dityrosine biosynthesis protein Dit1
MGPVALCLWEHTEEQKATDLMARSWGSHNPLQEHTPNDQKASCHAPPLKSMKLGSELLTYELWGTFQTN